MIKKMIVSMTLSIILFLLSVTNMNANIVFANEVKTPINITMVKDDSAVEVTFSSLDDKLGLNRKGTNLNWPGRSDWSYRTYRKIFLGWSPTKDYTGNISQKIYRDTDTIGTVIKDLGTKDIKLYQVFISQVQLQNLTIDALAKGQLGINHSRTALSTLYNKATIKEEKGFNNTLSKTRELTAYYDEKFEDKIPVNLEANFRFTDSRVPLIVIENPLNVIKHADNITNFSGEKPTTYTYEDLIVELDKELEVSTEMKNLVVTSPLYRVAAVLDENYNVLESTIERPTNGDLDTKFSFKNPNKKKKFIVRCVIRNFGANYGNANENNVSSTVAKATANQVLSMYLTSGDKGNVWIPKQKAQKYAQDGSKFVSFGRINGFMKLQKPNVGGIMGFIMGRVFNRLNSEIATKREEGKFYIKSSNDVVIKFVNNDEKTTRWVEQGDESHTFKAELKGKEFGKGEKSFTENGVVYELVNTVVSKDGKTKTYEYLRKVLPLTPPTVKLFVTRWVEQGNESHTFKAELKGKEFGAKEDSFTENGIVYELVNTVVSKDGKIKTYEYLRKALPLTPSEKKLTTNWVDEKGNPLKEKVTDKTTKEFGKIASYEFVKTTTDKFGNVTHHFKKVVEKVYKVSHKFVSVELGKDLPKSVNDLLPKDKLDLKNNTEVKPNLLEKLEVRVEGGKWVFKGYDKQTALINNKDEQFIGKWEFIKDDVVVIEKEIQYITRWVDENGEDLKTSVVGKTIEKAGEIVSYKFVKTTTDKLGNVKHHFEKVVKKANNKTTITLPKTGDGLNSNTYAKIAFLVGALLLLGGIKFRKK